MQRDVHSHLCSNAAYVMFYTTHETKSLRLYFHLNFHFLSRGLLNLTCELMMYIARNFVSITRLNKTMSALGSSHIYIVLSASCRRRIITFLNAPCFCVLLRGKQVETCNLDVNGVYNTLARLFAAICCIHKTLNDIMSLLT